MKLLTPEQIKEIAFLKSQMRTAAQAISDIAQQQGNVSFKVESSGGLIDIQVTVKSEATL